MKAHRFLIVLGLLLFSVVFANAQKAEITISLNEPFFDALVDAIYQNSPPPEFRLSRNADEATVISASALGFADRTSRMCTDSITLQRENKSVRTAVRFREGKILAPVAFSGNYSPPLVGCVDFTGYAETNVELVFDRGAQKLFGRVKVLNVNVDGTAGLGGSLIARMVQGSIDKKLNPIEIISLDKLSFPFTLQNLAKLRMKATSVRYDIVPGALNVVIAYEFVKD
jgi:hypothetical protein